MIKRILFALLLLIAVIGALAMQMGGEGTVNGMPLSNTGQGAPTLIDSPSSLDLLIFGGTSGIGLETSKLALSRGHTVTSITRRPERMPLEHENLINLKGDITDLDSFKHLFDGKHAIISSIGLKPSSRETTVYSDGMRNVLTAAGESDVDRVITITGIGAGDSKGHGGFFYDRILNPILLKEDYADKTRQESILKENASAWTIIRPGFLIDEASTKAYRVLNNTQGLVSGSISRADVAHFILATVEQGNHVRETIFVSN